MYIVRTGTNTVGLHFISFRSRYFARGWVSKLQMVEGGPMEFALLFGNQVVAHTTDGTITRSNFSPAALADLDAKIPIDSLELNLPAHVRATLFNLNPINQISLDATGWLRAWDQQDGEEVAYRQNFYMEQTWVQVMRQKEGTKGESDLDFEPLPCIRMYNLLDVDTSANVQETSPLVVR